MDVATTGARRVHLGGSLWQQVWETAFTGYSMIAQYIWQIQLFGNLHAVLMSFFLGLIFIGVLFLAVLSQTALVHGIKSPTHEHPNTVRKRAHDHLFRIFVIDVLTKLIGGLIVCLTTLPMLWYYTKTSTYSFSLTFLQSLFFFPSVLILSILSVLAVIHVIETESTVLEGVTEAWIIFKKHWVATLEYGFILFCLSSFFALVLLGVIILLSIPYALIYTASLLTGSFLVFVLSNILYGLFAAMVIFIIGGGIVTFQYSSWYLFYKRTGHPSHVNLPIAKILRIFHKI